MKSVDHLGDQAAKFASRESRRSPDSFFGLRVDRGIGPEKGRECIQFEVHNILWFYFVFSVKRDWPQPTGYNSGIRSAV